MVEIEPDTPRRTSYSSLRAWLGCQAKWGLLRVENAPSVPGWAGVGGKGVHLLTQWWETEYSGVNE